MSRRWLRRFWWVAAIVVVLAGIGKWQSARALAAEPYLGDVHTIIGSYPSGMRFHWQLARDPAKGLRGQTLQPRHGMFFPNPSGRRPAFTMAGVRRPLVLLHLDASGTLTRRSTMRPCASRDWQECPVYRGPLDTLISVEVRPVDVRRLRVGAKLLTPQAVAVVVR